MNIKYLEEVLNQLRTELGFKDGDEIPDGVYPVRINNDTDRVKIDGDTISVNNLKPKRAILKR